MSQKKAETQTHEEHTVQAFGCSIQNLDTSNTSPCVLCLCVEQDFNNQTSITIDDSMDSIDKLRFMKVNEKAITQFHQTQMC